MITVTYEGGDRLRIQARSHVLVADQPVADGGADEGPTPTELFVASLAACVAHYAQRFLRRHGLSSDGLRVTSNYRWAENPHRVGAIDLEVSAPGLPDGKRQAFARVIERCTVHSSITHEPSIRINLVEGRTAAA
ncbi:MAG TPA: OsmC family protein [Gemmatimonadales bacterium]|nr:OsmC family protein [Gemmatimonadales bacterium]